MGMDGKFGATGIANNKNSGVGSAAIGAAGGLLGMIGQGNRAKKAHNRNKELMGMQLRNQQALNRQGQELQMKTWRDTGYSAQMEMMKEAGLNPALMYGMSGGGGQTTGSQGGGSASGNSSHAPMDIGASVQASLAAAQVGKIVAETDLLKKKGKETDSNIVLNEKDADIKAEEIVKLGLENDESRATIADKIKLVSVDLMNAKLDGIKTTEETKAIIEDIKQKWEKLMQSGNEVNIKKFEAELKQDDLWKVLGNAGRQVQEDLQAMEDWLANGLWAKYGIGKPRVKEEKIPEYKSKFKN
jgi:hypothetical protein